MFLCFSYPWTHTRLSMQLTQHWPRNKWFLHVSSLKTGQWFQSFIWFRLKIGLLSNPVFVIIFSICVLSTYRIPLLWHVLPTLYIYLYIYTVYTHHFQTHPEVFFVPGFIPPGIAKPQNPKTGSSRWFDEERTGHLLVAAKTSTTGVETNPVVFCYLDGT
jgi:hypothetical protein